MGTHKFELNKGIKLEKSGTLVPWKTPLEELGRYGRPELREQPGKTIVTWKDEQIFDGLPVDLRVIYESSHTGKKELSCVSAYLCESGFDKARKLIGESLGTKSKFRRLNELEYQYIWQLRSCDIVLSHLDRFGSFWRIDIVYRPGFSGLFCIGRFFRKLPSAVSDRIDAVVFFRASRVSLTPA